MKRVRHANGLREQMKDDGTTTAEQTYEVNIPGVSG
jgi:hypothetical protein